MSLRSGTRLGPYEIVAPIGAGGMGEVYKARDTRLGRTVAIKVLPLDVSADHERRARFDREAKTVAGLNHPHICVLHDVGDHEGATFLVMEYVAGETLADRLEKGPLPLEEALDIARQIAEALEAAHERGIVHRDLKPANVKVTPEGKVKVLDFGLAKAVAAAAESDIANSPTLSEVMAATRGGVIVGTAAYMSPEQARGKPVDRRSDVWAFGCVLYELLAGKRAFSGETVADTIAQVLAGQPDWQALPPNTPAKIRDVLRRCLQKDPARRLRDIGDARLEIEEATAQPLAAVPEPVAPAVAPRPAWWKDARLWMGLAALAVAVATGALWVATRTTPAGPQPVTRFQIPLLPGSSPPQLAFSLDGTRLVYTDATAVVMRTSAVDQLHLRPLDALESTPVPDTAGASSPFFAPDGQRVGFFADGKLKKISLVGGQAATICNWPRIFGGAWGTDDTIVFGDGAGGALWRVPASGGTPQRLVGADAKQNEYYLVGPVIVPGGQAILLTGVDGSFLSPHIVVYSLKTRERRTLIDNACCPFYAPTGHLVYVQGQTLMGVRFDPKRLALAGTPAALVDGVGTHRHGRATYFALSAKGSLAYAGVVPENLDRTLVWVDRQEKEMPMARDRRPFTDARLSPDGKKLATSIGDFSHVWVVDLERSSLTQVTSEAQYDYWPIWTPDGRRIAFTSYRPGPSGLGLFWQPADGSGPAERLTTSMYWPVARSFTPDGKLLVFQQFWESNAGFAIWVLPLEPRGEPRPLLRASYNQYQPSLSPDGRWLAYVSDESGRDEIYVRPFPGLEAKWQISTDGGAEPAWAHSGRELFYRTGPRPGAGNKLMAVSIITQPEFHAATPQVVVDGSYVGAGVFSQSYDVAPDGKRFVMMKSEPTNAPREITVVLNWFEELNRRLPAGPR